MRYETETMRFYLLHLLITSVLFAQNPDPFDEAKIALIEHKQKRFENTALVKTASMNKTLSQNQFDAQYYKIEMQIKYNPNSILATVTGCFTSLVEDLSSIILDFDETLVIEHIGGDAISYNHEGLELTLNLNRSYHRHEKFSVEISYFGKPSEEFPNYFRFDVMSDGSPMVWTLSQPYGARYWWPCKDRPSDKADSVDIIVTVPEDQLVGSNGTLISVRDNDDRTKTFYWQERYPIATYLVSLAIGKYAHFQDFYEYGAEEPMLLDYYVYPDKLYLAQQIFGEMHDYLDALSFYFGPYPFLKEKYGQAQFGWGGAMEHQTLTSIGRVIPEWRYVYVHELGHQWFGDLVTCASWSEIWLNEGFASYSEALYAEWAGFRDQPPGASAYHAYMATQQFRNGGTIFIEDTSSFRNIFGLIVYDKGSWVLHMLRHIIGDEIFFDVLKSYAADERWTYGSVRTENFKEICETQSGMNLAAFFDQWLYYPFFPQYEYSWEIIGRDGNDYLVELNINQRQRTTVYEMPVELQFIYQSGRDTLMVIQNNQYFQNYVIHLREIPQKLIFDPHNWILKDAQEIPLEPFSTEVKLSRLGPNPFPSKYSNTINIEIIVWNNQDLKLEIFDILGRRVNTLKAEQLNQYSMNFSWDGSDQKGNKVSWGVYFILVVDDKNRPIVNGKSQKIIYLSTK